MGFLSSKKEITAYNGDMTVGAIPVATPVSGYEGGPITAQVSKYQPSQKAPPREQYDPTLSRTPMMMSVCPHCGQESRTRVTTYPTWQTWAAAGGLLFAFWPVCWMPLVLDNCKRTDHFCVLCGGKVGKVGAFQDCCVTEST